MRIFVDGPRFAGMWTEIVVDTLQCLGHRVDSRHHNARSLFARVGERALSVRARVVGKPKDRTWRDARAKAKLVSALDDGTWDILFSIQGPLDADVAAQLKARNKNLKIVYWFGDVLNPSHEPALHAVKDTVDLLLVSYRGDYSGLQARGFRQLRYFPFGATSTFHSVDNFSAADRQRFASDVSFVGKCYASRCEAIGQLNEALERPVRVWGRSWRHCAEVAASSGVSLADSLKVHALSKIALNIHHQDTRDGMNMKFYEIPASGGFQITNWQPALEELPWRDVCVSFKNTSELVDKVRYYLANDKEREDVARQQHDAVYAHASYATQLSDVLSEVTALSS